MIRFERVSIERAGQIAVEGVSLEVPAGLAVAVIGRSGAGKSTLLAAAATAVPLHAGDIVAEGRSVRRDPAGVRRIVGYAPNRLPAWPGLTAGEFLELYAAAAGLGGDRLRTAVAKALDLAGLGPDGRASLDALPPGPAKRLLIARALLHDPQVLLLDDPCGGLDPLERAAIERLVDDAHLIGRTVLAAIDDARVPACFTHLAVLREGRIVATGPTTPAAFAEGRRWTLRLACPAAADAAVGVLAARGIEARALDPDTVACVHDPAGGPFADVVAAVVQVGIPVEAAGFDPPWTAQLLDR